jgi:hypothetical protein
MLSGRANTTSFDAVRRIGLKLPDVEAATKYDGSPVLKVGGAFMVGLASHESADADTLVVRCDFEDRERMIEDAPDTYYVTEYYVKYPLVLVRLSHVNTDALRDLLAVSRQLTLPKSRKPATGSRAAVRRAEPGSRGRRAPR